MLQNHTTTSTPPNPILPSPARLGLTTTPSSPPPPSTSTSTSTTTSTPLPLLPLLPPLPRSHSLLLHLSSLSSHLFQLSPHRPFWLSSFRSSLPVFLPSDAPLPPHLTSTSDALSHFSKLLSLFSSSLDDLNSIHHLHRSHSSLSKQIQSLDGTLRDFARKLREAEKVLHLLLDDYSNYRDSNRNLLSVDEILSYAHRISYTTFAPPEFGAGTVPLRGALPPAPQDEQMRASQLYLVADLDVGVKKEAGERREERMVENLIEPTPPREEMVPPEIGAFPPISVPAGWKKGMPIDLPADLPPVPPGWKPGDPIPLPPLDAGGRVEEQRVVAPVAPVGRQAEPIQVKYVQLDINPEDDYSSEYSSDVGSSDEDDEE